MDMHKGYPSHGCTVNTRKTQVNFDITVDGKLLNNISRFSTGKHHAKAKESRTGTAGHACVKGEDWR
jgi:hypothetical protein